MRQHHLAALWRGFRRRRFRRRWSWRCLRGGVWRGDCLRRRYRRRGFCRQRRRFLIGRWRFRFRRLWRLRRCLHGRSGCRRLRARLALFRRDEGQGGARGAQHALRGGFRPLGRQPCAQRPDAPDQQQQNQKLADSAGQGSAQATPFHRRRLMPAGQRLAHLAGISIVFVQLVLEGRRLVIKGSTAALAGAAASQERQFEARKFQLSSPHAC
jgi:hypothetical protein